MNTENILPVIALRGRVVFPGTVMGFDTMRTTDMKAAEKAMETDSRVLLVSQKEIFSEKAEFETLYRIGCVAKVRQYAKLGIRSAKIVVEAEERIRLIKIARKVPYLVGEYEYVEQTDTADEIMREAFTRTLHNLFAEYMSVNDQRMLENPESLLSEQNLGKLADVMASYVNTTIDIKQQLLEALDVSERIKLLSVVLQNEIQISYTRRNIQEEVRKSIDANQREYYLREEIKAIEKELGGKEEVSEEIISYKKRIKELGLKEEYEEKLLKDAARLSKVLYNNNNDASVIRNYLDTVLELPWNKYTEDNSDMKEITEILDSEHFGMEEVKERVAQQLAVHSLTKGMNGTVLCLAGPPGTGKTSIAESVAKAMGRKFVRMALGGVHDEAEIRGHRKTYVGSMPGRIIAAIKQAGTCNPVILLDEIDKMANDHRGDPTSALLEVLDFEQNHSFRDNYLEIPFDLSNVMFIATANDLHNIPAPLYDRVEVIEIPGYTNQAKFEIAKRFLIPKQIKKNGLKGKRITVTDEAVLDIINYYTRESGVRELERKISAVMRKTAKAILSEDKKSARITSKNLTEYLGKKKFSFIKKNDENEVGTVRGLAWTSVGGDTLSVEVNVMSGTGKVELTGNLGEVMKESAMTAVSYVRSQADKLNIEDDFYKTKDIHIHVPEGAVPKDGPSAGITIATAVASALTNTPVKCDVAMTGEITLRGKVLPIGGLREKSLAAYRAGISTIVIPEKNISDIEDIPENVREHIKFIPASGMETVLEAAFSRI